MPWKETGHMKERTRFVSLAIEGLMPFSTLCAAFNVSRETGYKWVRRFEREGPEGLVDISRKPRSNPRSVDPKLISSIIEIKRQYPTWGPKKIAVLLKEQRDEPGIPATSTIGEVLKRNGLVKPRRSRFRIPQPVKPNLEMTASNDVWCTDFKGHFLLKDGVRCHPLTLTDGFSRYLLCCEALTTEAIEPTKIVFERIFQAFGLPKIILSDNGIPFASSGPIGLTRLSAWWVKLGITPIRIQPGHPEQNGRHERFHRTLKAQTARPPAEAMKEQQEAFGRFQEEYNLKRPHEALGQKRPFELYSPSSKSYPAILPQPEYPGQFETRRVAGNGEFSWKNKDVFLSEVLEKETVGLEEIAEDLWLIYFYHLPIAFFDEKNRKAVALPRTINKPDLSTMSPV